MTQDTTKRTMGSTAPSRTAPGKQHRSPFFWMGIGAALIAVAMTLATDLFPIITNDSLGYLVHSNSFGDMGLVEVGYRQIGYPVFLAGVDFVGTTLRIEPLLLTVLLQRILILTALAFAAWLWRWRATVLIAFILLPTMLVYSNFILNEGLGVGLILWYGLLVSWVVRMGSDLSENGGNSERKIYILGIVAAIIYLALVTLRSYFTLLGFGMLAVLYVIYNTGRKGHRIAIAILVALLLLGSGYLALTSQENNTEYGVFLPAVLGERAQFWMSWQETFVLNPDLGENEQLADLYANGNPYTVMREIDSLPTYPDQRERYSEEITRMFEERQTSWTAERLYSMLGVYRGGRIDDVHDIVADAAASSMSTVEALIYRNSIARRESIQYVDENFNNGRHIQPVITSPLAPLRTFPYFSTISRWLLPVAALLMLAGVFVKSTRRLSIVGTATLGSFAVLLGLFLQDSVRVVLIPLLFGLTIATGVADSGWRQRFAKEGKADRHGAAERTATALSKDA